MSIKDILGNEINIGDIIAYPGMCGHYSTINIGIVVDIVIIPKRSWMSDGEKVTKIKVKKQETSGWKSKKDKVITISRIDNIIKVSYPESQGEKNENT